MPVLPLKHSLSLENGPWLICHARFSQPTATLHTGPVDFREHWDKLRKPKANGLGDGVPLRVMLIGASMTLGEHSTGERGFRKQLRDWLVEQGNEVNYVGQVGFSPLRPFNMILMLFLESSTEPIR